jgi:hypothetical protein
MANPAPTNPTDWLPFLKISLRISNEPEET